MMIPSVKKLWKMYSFEGKSLESISKITGLPVERIRSELFNAYGKEYEILAKAKKGGLGRKKPKVYSNTQPIDSNEVWHLYAAEGYTIIKIALHFSVSEFKIRKLLLNNRNYG